MSMQSESKESALLFKITTFFFVIYLMSEMIKNEKKDKNTFLNLHFISWKKVPSLIDESIFVLHCIEIMRICPR